MERKETLKGVNLGGWLILERWMTPTVFEGSDAQDEYTLSQTQAGREAITKHRDAFIQESDFQWLHDNDIDSIRIPVGYWIFESTESLLPQVSYVDWAMDMAEKYSLKVVIDLHGLQGSQNGNDHSGRIGGSDWFHYPEFQQQSLDVLQRLADRYCTHPQLWGVQIINEPKVGIMHTTLRRYYHQAYEILQKTLRPDTHIIYSDGFTPRLLSGALPRSSQVIMDVHLYHFTKLWTKFCSLGLYYWSLPYQKQLIKRLAKRQPVIIGEWSGTFRQPVFDSFPVSDHPELVGEHIRKQLDSFVYATAWFYWSYKTEQPGVWNYRSQVEAGIIPVLTPATDQ